MLTTKRALLAATAVSLAVLSGVATADRGYYHQRGGRVHYGLTIGVPLWYPPAYSYYYPPYPAYGYPAYPPAVVVRPAPQVYVERDDRLAAEPPAAPHYWYFCRDSETYYPYVKQCASPWERVPARPATP